MPSDPETLDQARPFRFSPLNSASGSPDLRRVCDCASAEERVETAQVPVDLLHWVLAILSIVALLVFLVPLRWRAPEAGPMAMFVAGLVALLAFRTPWDTLAVASAKGVWDAIFILYVIWPALLLYQITKQAGAY